MRVLNVAAALLCSVPCLAQAQAFPSRQVTIIVPYQPGGNLGAALVAKSKPDGHTILMAPVGVLAINKWIYKDMGFDADREIVPIVNTGSVPNMLLVNNAVPVSSVRDLVALAKGQPNAINFASMGTGTTGHLCGEMFKLAVNVQATHVPYKGSAPALQDLLAGQVQIMFDNLPTALPRAKNGQLKGLAVTSLKRSPLAPEIPTMDEAGVPGYEATAWFGVVGPAGMPKPVIDRLNAEFVKALRDAQNAPKLESQGLAIIADSPEHFAAYIAAESQKLRKVVTASGAKAD